MIDWFNLTTKSTPIVLYKAHWRAIEPIKKFGTTHRAFRGSHFLISRASPHTSFSLCKYPNSSTLCLHLTLHCLNQRTYNRILGQNFPLQPRGSVEVQRNFVNCASLLISSAPQGVWQPSAHRLVIHRASEGSLKYGAPNEHSTRYG